MYVSEYENEAMPESLEQNEGRRCLREVPATFKKYYECMGFVVLCFVIFRTTAKGSPRKIANPSTYMQICVCRKTGGPT